MLRKGMFISDRYEIIDKVGSGGMSDVYKALDHKLNRNVAMKVLKQEFSEDKSFVSKFKIEAQNAAGLSHPNIVNVFDVGEDGGLYYIVMELIEGITLKKYIDKKGHLPVKEAVSIAVQVAQGIEAAHNNHIIHRDIKPQNIIISREGKVKVTDFGIARAASTNTISSNAMGSVHYISPEQAKGGFIDEKSDIYSLGITLYEMITGRVPFEGDTTVAIALQHVQNELPSPKMYVENLPISVEKIILKSTQKRADRRYLKVSAMIADLKKSLISPDEDFVQMVSIDDMGATITISDKELSKIRSDSGFERPADIDIPVIGKDNNLIKNDYEDLDDDELDGEDDIDDLDEENPKLDKIIAIGGIVCGVVLLIVIAVILINIFGGGCSSSKPNKNETTTSNEETTLDPKHTLVPDVLGLTEDEAIAAIKKANLGYRITQEYDNEVEEGKVISTSVEAKKVVEKNTTVVLTISKGAKEMDIPDIIGKTKEEAKAILKEAGLNPIFEYKADATIELDKIIDTDPKAPNQIKYGDDIKVFVSSGNESTDVVVPKVIGLTKDAAKATLEGAKLKLGEVKEENSDTVAAGLITRQSVEENGKLPENSTVNVWISLGKEENPTVPSIAGMSIENAKKALKDVGLELGNQKEERYSDIPKGNIIASAVDAGTTVEKGSKIDYIVSLGKEPETTTQEPTTEEKKDVVAKASVSKDELNLKYTDENGEEQTLVDGDISAAIVVNRPNGKVTTQDAPLSTGKLSKWSSDNFNEVIESDAESAYLKITVNSNGQTYEVYNKKMYVEK